MANATREVSLTPEQIKALAEDLDALYQRHSAYLPGDGSLESVLLGIAEVVQADAATQSHDLIKACLEGCADDLRSASLAWYSSWK